MTCRAGVDRYRRVEVLDESHDAGVDRVLEEVEGKLAVVTPLERVGNLRAPMKSELLAGKPALVPEKRPVVGEAPPLVPGHPAE